jgi:hypothetical protein
MTGCQGQDWASYQDYTPNTGGLAFVFVKTTEGLSYVNPKAASQVATARSGGLVVGHYHYPHMANNAAAECDYFLTHANAQPGDILVLDWEGYDTANKNVPWERQVAYKGAFLARLRAAAPTRQRLTYCNTDYLGRDPKGEYGDGLWIATAGRPAGEPGIDHQWLIHQYSTAGGIDHDYCPLSPAELRAWAHAKEDTDMPLTDADVEKLLSATMDDPTRTGREQITVRGALWAAYGQAHQAAADAAKLRAQVTALSAAVQTLAGHLGKQVDTAAVVAAVQKAIAAAVVHVDVDVTGPTQPTA